MNVLNEIKTLLGMDVKLEQLKLKDGTVLEAETLEAGQSIFILNGEEKVPVPVGDYELENGQVLVVAEEGIIAEIKEKAAAEEEVVAAEEEAPTADYVTREEFDELKAKIDELLKKPEAVEMSAVEPQPETVEPEPEPFKHNPEAETKKVEPFKFGRSKPQSTLDIVLNKLNK